MGNRDFQSLIKSFFVAGLGSILLWCGVQLWYQEVYNNRTSKPSPTMFPVLLLLFFFQKTQSKWDLCIQKCLNELL